MRYALAGSRCARRVDADVHDLALDELELLGLGARELRGQQVALRRQQLDADLEAESHDPRHDGLLARLAGLGQHLHVVRAHQRAAHARDRADERHHELRGGLVVDLGRRRRLLDPALVDDHDLLGDLHRLLLVVRDEDRRHVHLVVQPPQPGAQLLAHAGVQSAERLVEQQHARLDGQRARERHPLALAAGELRRVALAEVREADELEQLGHARA